MSSQEPLPSTLGSCTPLTGVGRFYTGTVGCNVSSFRPCRPGWFVLLCPLGFGVPVIDFYITG